MEPELEPKRERELSLSGAGAAAPHLLRRRRSSSEAASGQLRGAVAQYESTLAALLGASQRSCERALRLRLLLLRLLRLRLLRLLRLRLRLRPLSDAEAHTQAGWLATNVTEVSLPTTGRLPAMPIDLLVSLAAEGASSLAFSRRCGTRLPHSLRSRSPFARASTPLHPLTPRSLFSQALRYATNRIDAHNSPRTRDRAHIRRS